ncbi:MAG: hypothetical protein PHG05_02185 [Candidatus Nanoarchaeia archaeon]|nr:hypothetical protein [Candidatus Nanoarchaeia archaeon]
MIETKKGNIYLRNHREEMLENDEISPEEEGFMNGYEDFSLFF